MTLEFKPLRKKDTRKVIDFAIVGMHFNLYVQNKLALRLYGRYFWYDELQKATHLLALYDGDQLLGVLAAAMNGATPKFETWGKHFYTWLFIKLQNLWFGNGADTYDQTNRKLYAAYRQKYQPDGQIVFLAVDPNSQGQGVGTKLLAKFSRQLPGKQVYLYTDDACQYQFYEHRGFTRSGAKKVVLDLNDKRVPLTCLLYHKRFAAR